MSTGHHNFDEVFEAGVMELRSSNFGGCAKADKLKCDSLDVHGDDVSEKMTQHGRFMQHNER